jgi:hypothetical protein
MSYNNLKRICGNLKAIKRLKLLSLRLCLVTWKQEGLWIRISAQYLPCRWHSSADPEVRLLPITLPVFKLPSPYYTFWAPPTFRQYKQFCITSLNGNRESSKWPAQPRAMASAHCDDIYASSSLFRTQPEAREQQKFSGFVILWLHLWTAVFFLCFYQCWFSGFLLMPLTYFLAIQISGWQFWS